MPLHGFSRHAWIAALFIICAVVLGGGGSPTPQAETLLQLVGCLALLAWIWVPAKDGTPYPAGRLVWLLAALAVALPLLQSIPLPPTLWHALPGQEDRVAALALVGQADSWQPLTQSPPRTLAGLLAIVPALFAFLATAALRPADRQGVILAIAAAVLLSALFGAAQIALGHDALRLYSETHTGYVTGFQANRNAEADVLLIGMAAIAAALVPGLVAPVPGPRARAPRHLDRLPSPARQRGRWLLLGGLLILLLLAVVLTGSRMGMALIAVALIGCWVILRRPLAMLAGESNALVRWLALPAMVAVALIAAYLLLEGNTVIGRSAMRFDATSDPRSELWRDTWFAIQSAWPSGVGMGGFQPAMLAAERLEVLDTSRPNRAHNDYLELLLEGGLPAVLILVAATALIGLLAVRGWRARPSDQPQIALGLTLMTIVALHSLVDYPLRSMALACLFGVGTGLLASAPRTVLMSARDNNASAAAGIGFAS